MVCEYTAIKPRTLKKRPAQMHSALLKLDLDFIILCFNDYETNFE